MQIREQTELINLLAKELINDVLDYDAKNKKPWETAGRYVLENDIIRLRRELMKLSKDEK